MPRQRPEDRLIPLPPPSQWATKVEDERRPERLALVSPAAGGGVSVAITPDESVDRRLIPIRDYDYSVLENTDPERDELVRMWLSNKSFGGLGAGPSTEQELSDLQQRASAIGLSINDIIDEAEEQMPFADKQAMRIYRNGGPLTRGAMDSAGSTINFVANTGARGISFIPGLEWLSEWADSNNRAQSVQERITETLDREGALGEMLSPSAAAFVGNVGQAGTDILSIYAGGVGAALPKAAKVGATGAAATSSVMGAKTATKAAAAYYGLRRVDQEITVAKDAGLSPTMQIVHPWMMGGSEAALTLAFGNLAGKYGLATAEEAIGMGAPAARRLAARTGLNRALAGIAMESGEEAAIATSQLYWGAFAGTDSTDDAFNRIATQAATGGVTRGVLEITPAVRRFRDAMIRTQQELPDTVKGTVEAHNAVKENREPNVPEGSSEAYKTAVETEIAALQGSRAVVQNTLDGIKTDQATLKQDLDFYLQKRKEHNSLKNQILNTTAATPELGSESEGFRSQRDALLAAEKTAASELADMEKRLSELAKTRGKEIHAKIVTGVETAQIKEGIEQSKAELTSAQDAVVNEVRSMYDLSALPERDAISVVETHKRAIEQGIPQKAMEIAADVNRTDRSFSTREEQEGVRIAANRLLPQLDAAKQLSDSTPADAAEYKDADLKWRALQQEFNDLTLALDKGGSEAGGVLGARSRVDSLEPMGVNKTIRRVKGSDPTVEESQKAVSQSFDLKKIEERRDKARERRNKPRPPKKLDVNEFVLNELDRAEIRKGGLLTDGEKQNVVNLSRDIYQSRDNINQEDALRDRDLLGELLAASTDKRIQLDEYVNSLAPKTFTKQLAGQVAGLLDTWRALLLAGDLMPIFRQGITSPIRSIRESPVFIKALRSRNEALILDDETRKRPTAKYDGTTGVAITGSDTPFFAREDFLLDAKGESRKLIGPFQRAMRVYLNRLRATMVDAHVRSMGGYEALPDSTLKKIGTFVNDSTGYSHLGALEQSSYAMAQLMTGPRFFWSRLRHGSFWPLFRAAIDGDATASKLMAREYAKQVAGLAMMATAAVSFGKMFYGDEAAEYHWNPTDRNFGRLRVGNTMIDLSGGLARPYRYAFGLTEKSRLGARAGRDPGDVALGIARSAAAPVIGAGVTALDMAGGGRNSPTSQDFLLDYSILPWSWGTMVEAFKNENIPEAMGISFLSLFGAGGFSQQK